LEKNAKIGSLCSIGSTGINVYKPNLIIEDKKKQAEEKLIIKKKSELPRYLM
jgi:hypothetical protein